jgi:hypothetical protein
MEIPSGNLIDSCLSSLTSNQLLIPQTDFLQQEILKIPVATERFSFRNALEKLPFKEKCYKKLQEYEIDNLNISFTKALFNYWSMFYEFQKIGKFKFVVVKKDFKGYYNLLYDGRCLKEVINKWPLKVWYLNSKKNFVVERKSLPKLHNLPIKSEPLWKLLKLPVAKPDPQNYNELTTFFANQTFKNDIKIIFLLSYPTATCDWYNIIGTTTADLIFIDAFTKKDYTIGYKEKIIVWDTPKVIEPKIPFKPDPHQHNRSAAVNVKLFGLNEAYNLNCITMTELHDLSKQLGDTYGCIYLALDFENETRFITFRDNLGYVHFEITDLNSWTKFFNFIYQKNLYWAEKKRNILHVLLQKLTQYSKIQSPYKKCLFQLNACIENYKIVLFSTDDSQIHSIKLQFSHWINKTFPKRHFTLSLTNDACNNLCVIKNKEFTLFNLSAYLSESDLFSKLLPEPIFEKNKIIVTKQKKQNSGLSTWQHCVQRGQDATKLILTTWKNVGIDFLAMFDFDIFSMHFMSLSYLSFQTVWTKYTRLGGIYHHGLEKTKPYYEDMLRNHSHGGYFYSCQDKLDAGQPLHKTFGNPASSISEFDIVSSYGYASSNIRIPSGFCYGYIANEKGTLVRCDKTQRHKTFEFLSVFYTLHLLEQQGYIIQTVYSNFHQFGIFSIGNYPIDLVAICEKNIFFYQFDGQYVHGCLQCPTLDSYIGNRTQDQVLQLTNTRNAVINQWCNNINITQPNYATFVIKTDCHDYNVKDMFAYFQLYPQLFALISCYPNTFELDLNHLLNSSADSTFIADVHGFIPCNSKALFVQEEKKKWTRESKTLTKSILLTKDYFEYLQQKFNFQVISINSVFFYKKCSLLNQIFKTIVADRMNPNITPGKKQLLKNIVNYSAGFFGFNQSKASHVTNKIVSKVPYRQNATSLPKHFLHSLGFIEDNDYFIISTYKQNDISKKRKSCCSPLPLYVSIVEFGKLRMSQILAVLDYFIDPQNFRHLYSNIDNIIIALAHSTIEDCIKPELKQDFLAIKPYFFTPNEPGHFKQEYCFTQDQLWKFVSPCMQNYALITKDINQSVHKSSALRYLSSQNSYDYSLKMLDNNPISITQVRRVNKIVNMKVENQIFTFNK